MYWFHAMISVSGSGWSTVLFVFGRLFADAMRDEGDEEEDEDTPDKSKLPISRKKHWHATCISPLNMAAHFFDNLSSSSIPFLNVSFKGLNSQPAASAPMAESGRCHGARPCAKATQSGKRRNAACCDRASTLSDLRTRRVSSGST